MFVVVVVIRCRSRSSLSLLSLLEIESIVVIVVAPVVFDCSHLRNLSIRHDVRSRSRVSRKKLLLQQRVEHEQRHRRAISRTTTKRTTFANNHRTPRPAPPRNTGHETPPQAHPGDLRDGGGRGRNNGAAARGNHRGGLPGGVLRQPGPEAPRALH